MREVVVAGSVTLAHLSDVHLPFAGGVPIGCLNVKRALGWLNWQRKRRFVHQREALDKLVADVRREMPDHLLVSGDLVNIGLPREYRAARDWLAALGPPDRVSVVPGNHDAYVTREAEPGMALWVPYMSSDGFGRTIDGARDGFPYVRRVGPVAIVGVNSGIATRPGSAVGEVGAEQRGRLSWVLERLGRDGLVRLVMIHHPPVPGLAPPQRALLDAEALSDVLLAHGAELVVHGHNHVMSSVMSGESAIEGVASASAGRAYSDEPMARYNLFRIERHGDGTRIEVETRGLDRAGQSVVRVAVRTIHVHTHRAEVQDKGSMP